MKKHWRTTLIGVAAMILGTWSFKLHWLHDQSIYFNICYSEIPSIGLIVAGWIGIHAADHKNLQ